MMCGIYLSVIFCFLQAKTVACADVSLVCPAQFAENEDNPVTCTVNKAEIDKVTCSVPQNTLGFGLKRRTEQSGSPLCDATYPCTSEALVTTPGTCGCTKLEGDIFTYTLLFEANETTDEGGTITCQICDVSVPPLSRSSSKSCKSILFSNPVLGQDDVVLTCPQEWVLNSAVTLYCEVSKSSITSKCDTAPQNTFFTQDGVTPRCTVGPAHYTSCNSGEPSSTSCGCRQNTTHYTFVYHISEVGEDDSGDWDCTKACNPATGFQNPLTKQINAFCTGVSIEGSCAISWPALVFIVLAQIVLVFELAAAFYVYVYKNTRLVRANWNKHATVVGLMMTVVILMALSFSIADDNLPEDDRCNCTLYVVAVFTVLDVVWVMITGIIIILQKHLLDTDGTVLDFPFRSSLTKIAFVIGLTIVVAGSIIALVINLTSKINFCDTTSAMWLLTAAQVTWAWLNIDAIYVFVWRKNPLSKLGRNLTYITLVIQLLLTMTMTYLSLICKKIPEEGPCFCLCWSIISVLVIGVVELVITVVVIILNKCSCSA